LDKKFYRQFIVPNNPIFFGVLANIVLQILAYELSVAKGINPDKPRNLAKVVTVD
jgi:glucosamine--fructose-6-phosphate aminotransferase (isomerizing)